MAIHKCRVSIRCWHPSMRAIQIAAGVELNPETSWDAGDERRDATGQPLTGIRKSTYCVFDVEESAELDFDDRIVNIVYNLNRRRTFIRRFLESGGVMELFCGMFFERSGGFSMKPELLRAAADLGVTIGFDLYEEPGAKVEQGPELADSLT